MQCECQRLANPSRIGRENKKSSSKDSTRPAAGARGDPPKTGMFLEGKAAPVFFFSQVAEAVFENRRLGTAPALWSVQRHILKIKIGSQ